MLAFFLVSVVGEGRSLAEKRERLLLPLSGVGAERSIKVLMLAVCAVPVCTGVCASVRVMRFALALCAVSVCTGGCAAVRVTAARVVRPALGGDEGGSVVSVAEG